MFVENKPGASGIIAIQEMARATPDGYTIMIGNISTNGLTPARSPRRCRSTTTARCRSSRGSPTFRHSFSTTTDFPPKTFAEFIAYAKAHRGMVRYGSAGIGSYQHISTESLARRAGLSLLHIPFKDGGAQLLQNLAGGQVEVLRFDIANPVGMIQEGRVAPLAIAAPQRLPDYPDVSTIAELVSPARARPSGSPRLRRPRYRRTSLSDCTRPSPRQQRHRTSSRRSRPPAWWRRHPAGRLDCQGLAQGGDGSLEGKKPTSCTSFWRNEVKLESARATTSVSRSFPNAIKVMKAAAARTGLPIEWHPLPIGKRRQRSSDTRPR